MIEEDYAIHLRSRDDFFKSLFLTNDFSDEVSNYLGSLQNLRHKGYVLQKNFFDDVCYRQASLMLKNVPPPPSQDNQMASFVRTTMASNLNHIWSDAMVNQSDNVSEYAARWPEVEMSPGGRYQHHPNHEKIHPLRRKNSKTGRSNMIEELRGYYLASDGGLSLAALDDERDSKIEEYHKDHKTIRGIQKPITKESFSPFLNSLKTSNSGKAVKEHAGTFTSSLYERAYNRWRQSPKAQEAIASGMNDRQLREQHFEDAADLWDSDDYQESLETVKEKIEGFDDYFDTKEVTKKHPHRLGWLGHKLGLEWLEPKERTEVVEHLNKNGAHTTDGQIKLSTGLTIPLGRIVRNMMVLWSL